MDLMSRLGLAAVVLTWGCTASTVPAGPTPPRDEPDAGGAAVRVDTRPAVPSTDGESPYEAGSDGRTVDAEPRDAPAVRDGIGPSADGLVLSGTCKGALLCDDFEGYAQGARPGAPWTVDLSSASSGSVDGTRFWSGGRAMKFAVPANGMRDQQAKLVLRNPPFPVAANAFYGRAMMYFDQLEGPSNPENILNTFIFAKGPLAAGGSADYGFLILREGLSALYHSYPMLSHCGASTRASSMPAARWACVEWQTDGAKYESRLWIDGAPVAPLTIVRKGGTCLSGQGPNGDGTWVAPTFDYLHIGVSFFRVNALPVQLWIDDVAIDTKRVGCPAPR